jgi:hypothetical protein
MRHVLFIVHRAKKVVDPKTNTLIRVYDSTSASHCLVPERMFVDDVAEVFLQTGQYPEGVKLCYSQADRESDIFTTGTFNFARSKAPIVVFT